MKKPSSGGGLAALGFAALLSPCVRRYPRLLAAMAGRSAYLAPLPAAAVLALALALVHLARRRFRCESLGGLFRQALGPALSRPLLLLYALWLTAYAGFLLRAGADRFVTTVYPGAGPGLFVLTMALLCLPAALGPLRALTRFARLVLPPLLALPLLLLLLAAKDMDPALLLPVTGRDALPVLRAGLDAANTLLAGALLLFQADAAGRTNLRSAALWGGALLGLTGLVTAGCTAMFGPELVSRLRHPFFLLVRDVTVLGAVERVEPVVAALWVLSDFAFLAALLSGAARCAAEALAADTEPTGASQRAAKWAAGVCAAGAVCAALWGVPDKAVFDALNDLWMPLGNLLFAAALPVLALGTAGARTPP